MKSNNKCLYLLTAVILFLTLELVISDVLGGKNGPNYWGMGFPGNFSTDDYYRAPKKPSDYIFAKGNIEHAQTYDGSHYGTHDWIADAALRTLRNPIKNPLYFGNWTWMINSDIARNKWPAWNKDYGIKSGSPPRSTHNVIRSYFSFIFATQMPDMDKEDYPDIQMIDIPHEDVTIRDFPKPNMWIGQEGKHNYHFKYNLLSSGSYSFSPYYTGSARIANLLGKEAIKCISNQKINNNGKKVSAMQPEGASGWLGAMTHYFADLAVPAHLIEKKRYPDIYGQIYHTWFEKWLANVTKWDKEYKALGGPEQTVFSWDTHKVTLLPIIPIPPDIAIERMAEKAIKIAFRSDGNHQHIPFDGNNHAIAENSGLFINHNTYDTDFYWKWDEDLKNGGRFNSSHRYYYDKVEKLLCWSVYYTTCAMQYCYNKGRKKNNNEAPDPNQFVDNPVRDSPIDEPPRIPPAPDPLSGIDRFLNLVPPSEGETRIARNFKNFARLIASVAIAGIPDALRKILKVASSGPTLR